MLAIMVDFEKKSNRSKDQMVLKITDQRTGIRNDLYKRTLYRFEGSEKILQRTLKTAQEETKQLDLFRMFQLVLGDILSIRTGIRSYFRRKCESARADRNDANRRFGSLSRRSSEQERRGWMPGH